MKKRTLLAPPAHKPALRWAALLLALAPAACAQRTIHVPADAPTIQLGIDAASPGDTVLVSPNTYAENIDFHGKAITVTSSAGPSTTILDGGSRGPVVSFTSGEPRASILNGFTIQNGSGPPQTPSHTRAPAQPSPRGIADAPTGSGGIFVSNSAPTIRNNTITTNRCNGIYSVQSSPLIQGNHVTLTTWAAAVNGLTPQCGPDQGTGISLTGAFAAASGQAPISPAIIANTIDNNDLAAVGTGGGITLNSAPGTLIQGNLIRGNSGGNATGALSALASPNLFILQNIITGNTVSQGALTVQLSGHNGPPTTFLLNNTITGDLPLDPTSPIAEVITYGAGSENLFGNNIVVAASSKAAWFCDPAFAFSGQAPVVADHNDLQNTQGPLVAGACTDPTGSSGNISANPRFSNAATGDLHLLQGSPAIDSGNNSALALLPPAFTLATDFSTNQPRLQDATPLGYTVVDMGAYEAPGAQTSTPTTITLSPSSFSPIGGASATLTATLSSAVGIPTGSVSFFEDHTAALGAGTLDPTGAATITTPPLTPGLHSFAATYTGQSLFTSAVSVPIYLLVDRYPVTLSGASSPNPAVINQPVTFTFTIRSADNTIPPYIQITQTDGTPIDTLTPDNNGVATYTQTYTTSGAVTILANYPGDTTHGPAATSVSVSISNRSTTSTTVTTSANPSVVGQPVTLTATVLSQTNTTSSSTYGMVNFGDSITCGAGGWPSYTDILHSEVTPHGPDSTVCWPGDRVEDMNYKVFSQMHPSDTANPIATTLIGTNDNFNINSAHGREWVGQAYSAYAWMALPASKKFSASSATRTGTWTDDTTFPTVTGSTSSTLGSSVSWNLNPTNGVLLVWYRGLATSGGTFTCTVDGNPVIDSMLGSSTLQTAAGLPTANGAPTDVQVARFPVPNGAHALACSVTSPTGSGNSVSILASGIPSPTLSPDKSAPRVYAGGVIYQENDANSATTATLNQWSQSAASLASADGMAVVFVPVRNYINSTVDMSSSTQDGCAPSTNPGLHPNACGHRALANAFEDYIGAVPANISPASTQQVQPTNRAIDRINRDLADPVIPGGSVIFSENSTILATIPLSGASASWTTSSLSVGSHNIKAAYVPTNSFARSFGSITQQIVGEPTSTAITASPQSTPSGQTVYLTATVSNATNTPTGSVTFLDGANILSTQPLVNGIAHFATSTLAVGSHTLTASYTPTGNFAPSSATTPETITALPPTTTLLAASGSPVTLDTPVTFTANISAGSANLIGTVSFSDGAQLLAVVRVDSSGTAVYQSPAFALSVGSHVITAAFTPVGPFLASSAHLTETITATPTSLALISSANPAFVTAPVTLTAALTASTIQNAPLSGTITFLDGAGVLGTVPVNSSGAATYTTSSLTVGQHTLQATYTGDSVHGPSTSSTLPETIQPLPTALSVHLPQTPVTAFSTVPITATLSIPGAAVAQICRPACQIVFSANGSLLGSAPTDATGSATLTANVFPAGTYTITASFAQTPNLSPSIASATLTVTPAPTVIHLSAAPNPAIQFQLLTIAAAVTAPGSSAAPTGQIAFQDGATPLALSPITTVGSAQAASFSTSALSPGTHLITAIYPATPNFLPATATLSVTVLPQDFTLSAAPTISIPTEHHATLTLNLTSVGSFSDQIDLACGTLPLYASCVFNGPVALTPDAKLSVTVHLDTDAVFDYARLQHTPTPPQISPNPAQTGLKLAAVLPLGLFFASRRKPRRLLKFTLLALTTLATLTLTSCSGKYPGHTAPGTYTFQVIASGRTSGITHTTPITLTVTE